MPVTIQICVGPTCGPLANNLLRARLAALPAAEREQLILEPRHCFSRCKRDAGLCPTLCIDGDWHNRIDERAMLKFIRKRLAAGAAPASQEDPAS
jgi:hypothetical protein